MELGSQIDFLGVTAVIESELIRRLIETVQHVARSNATVLITGESGSGKEILARAIHHYSLRCNRAWVDINCGALPETLVESELFGYEKGAFSGADAAKPGLFEQAANGTLFLDEIGELDPRMQVKLLRVLDGVPYYRVGGTRKVTVDVRIVAATNQDLRQSVAAGRFRSDLYHRLNQFPIHVPPLRERTDAIERLARYFLTQQGCRALLTQPVVERLRIYDWPGNVRELRNVMARVALMSRGAFITPADLPSEIVSAAPVRAAETGARLPCATLNLEEMERTLIMGALEQAGQHRQKAATLLGISRRTLTRKLKVLTA